VPITLVVGGILAMAFMGFTGVDSGLKKALTPPPAAVQESAAVEDRTPASPVAVSIAPAFFGKETIENSGPRG
jgi:electron transport complex protein RnfA